MNSNVFIFFYIYIGKEILTAAHEFYVYNEKHNNLLILLFGQQTDSSRDHQITARNGI